MENIDYEGLVKALKARRFLSEVFNTAADAMQARNVANAAAGLRPRQPQARLRPGDKREGTMAW